MKFEYIINENNKDIYELKESLISSVDPEVNEKIEFRLEKNQSISIIGNKKGWEYLAKLCVEMAFCSEKYPTFHLHRKANMSDANYDNEIMVSLLVKSET